MDAPFSNSNMFAGQQANNTTATSSSSSSRSAVFHKSDDNNDQGSQRRVNVDDFLTEELSQMSLTERNETLHVLKDVVETDENLSLAKELNKMSCRERERILYDIHGVGQAVQETPQLLQASLVKLDHAIQVERSSNASGGFSSSQKSMAYDLAESISPNYVQDANLRLLFLRTTEFDCPAAAKRMLNFFTFKLELFGRDKLCKHIQTKDLSKEDLECLTSAHMQLLPSRDPAGRAIMAYLAPWMPRFKSIENLQRAQFYQIMTWLQDEETQKNGFVVILYRCGLSKFPKPDPLAVWKNITLFSILPFQIKSWHLCAVHHGHNYLWPTRWLLEKRTRIRTRIHHGSHVECMYELMTFGIPIPSFPVTDDIEIRRDLHLEWLASMQRLETPQGVKRDNNPAAKKKARAPPQTPSSFCTLELSTSSTLQTHHVIVPSQKDVLFGRGKPIQEHKGNLRLGIMLESVFERYESLKRTEKRSLAQEVVLKIKSTGGRFLRQSGGIWEEVDDDTAREKVSHTFRSLRSAAAKSSNNNNSNAVERKKKKMDDQESQEASADQDDEEDKKRLRLVA